ncbi:NUMOD4 domain-containing protein [bacterium]|nr:NUMOD4 domain-containing protein [bacterium]
MEEWKDIEGYKGKYQVSSYGNVRSLSMMINNKHNTLSLRKGKILKGTPTVYGYLSVSLHRDNKKTTSVIHKLVAIAFLNHKPCGHEEVVDHIDNNKLNNRLDNLQLISHRENCSKDKTGGSSNYTGVQLVKAKNDNCKDRFVSSISYKCIERPLGSFNTELEASEAYQKALEDINNGTFKDRVIIQHSSYRGVTWVKLHKKWLARIYRKGKSHHLGYFYCETAASLAYQTALKSL